MQQFWSMALTRVFITGAGGFVGGHLERHLLALYPDIEIHGTILPTLSIPHQRERVFYHPVDLKVESAVRALITELRPDYIYHLAAQAFVPRSFEAPWETLENNILAQLNVILACLGCGLRPRMLVVSSAEIYGHIQPHEVPVKETADLRPTSPYSVSKIAQDMLAYQYYLSHRLPIMRARPFNHFGPGQHENFVAPAFGMQIARIETGLQEPIIHVGDLSAKRDFTDVRDIVRAYQMITERGTPGGVYNVASNKAYPIQVLLDTMIAHSKVKIDVMVDAERLRPVTIPILQGDCTHLHTETGWQPQISFEQSVADIMNDCRQRVTQ
jgi:GDP-4-dehydro-6-deoxy-D-mannose reductase